MKSLGEIYWDIDHQCREENISLSDESIMLHHAAEEYVENLLKHDRWKYVVKSDIENLKASSFIRREIKGYSFGAELLLSFTKLEIERFGYDINDIIDPITHELTQTGDDDGEGQETTQTDTIPETGDDKNGILMTKPQIMMSIKNEPFKPKKDGKPIPYQKCFDRLTTGKIRRSAGESEPVEVIKNQYDLELFEYCVNRANIKFLIKEKKCFAYLFLRCISEYFENPFEYRKAAAKSFGIKTICSVGGDTKSDFYNLFSGIFKDEDIPRMKRK